jgi:hypothetical protein
VAAVAFALAITGLADPALAEQPKRVAERQQRWLGALPHYLKLYRPRSQRPTTGVEIELVTPEALPHAEIARRLACAGKRRLQVLETPGYPFGREGPIYLVGSDPKGNPRGAWQVKADSSIRPVFCEGGFAIPEPVTGLEIASPVLHHAADEAAFFSRLGAFEGKVPVEARPDAIAAVHVHQGFVDPLSRDPATLAQAAVLLGIYAAIEGDAMAYFKPHPNRVWSDWVTPVREKLRPMLDRIGSGRFAEPVRPTDEPPLKHHGATLEKTYLTQGIPENDWKLSLALRPGLNTVEFGVFNTTIDRGELASMIDFARKLVRGVQGQDRRLVELLESNAPSLRLQDVARALEMKIADDPRLGAIP